MYKIGDIVSFTRKGQKVYMIIDKVTEKRLHGYECDKFFGKSEFWVDASKAQAVSKIKLETEDLRKYANATLLFDELVADRLPWDRFYWDEEYQVTMADMLILVDNLEKMGYEKAVLDWFDKGYYGIDSGISYGNYYSLENSKCSAEGTEGVRYLPKEIDYVRELHDMLQDDMYNIRTETFSDYLNNIREKIAQYMSDQELPVQNRHYRDRDKRAYISSFDHEHVLNSASEIELELYRKFAEELAENDDTKALYALAYSYYGGNKAYPCDWEKSRDYLLRLMKLDENPFIANTLGYIFYYGRCNNGDPEYDKAFYYYSIGAAGGVYESKYKLSDMFRHGYGVPKNMQIAKSIIQELYNENLKYLSEGFYECKFADIALRMGILCEDGNDLASVHDAYYYYLQADYAIRMRMNVSNQYGDRKVAAGVREAIERVLPKNKLWTTNPVYFNLGQYITSGHLYKITIKEKQNGKMSAKVVRWTGNKKNEKKIFLTYPEARFCGMVDQLSFTFLADFGVWTSLKFEKTANGEKVAEILFDEVIGDYFYRSGEKVAEVSARWILRKPSRTKEKKYRMAAVAFDNSDKWYDYILKDDTIQEGDVVKVKVKGDLVEGRVMKIIVKRESELSLPIQMYKSIGAKE